MGGGQSARSSHFQRPDADDEDEDDDGPHISISNKMVERLVEDATVAPQPPEPPLAAPREERRDQVYSDKLRLMDDKHTKRWGLSVEELNALASRVDRRTANMVNSQPVCELCEQQVLECFSREEGESGACFDTVEAFKKCVQREMFAQLNSRVQRDARDNARRSRHVARARENVFKEIGETTAA